MKPTDLKANLCRLVTPLAGTVLDPFMGSGSTGKSAKWEGFRFVGIDMTPEYVEIARARIRFECEHRDEEQRIAIAHNSGFLSLVENGELPRKLLISCRCRKNKRAVGPPRRLIK
ncbi:hypothetical protein PPGU19_070090 (plasmid) [Paraburkholderia sp. PGU19]|nr:hypothetical protein PPGU19_070090 [Paraburkholderia sp. PGU19]